MLFVLVFRFSWTTTHTNGISGNTDYFCVLSVSPEHFSQVISGAVFVWFSLDFLYIGQKRAVDRSKYRKMKTELGITAVSVPR